MYFRNEHAKVEIALARGKRKYDKRETIRNRRRSGTWSGPGSGGDFQLSAVSFQ